MSNENLYRKVKNDFKNKILGGNTINTEELTQHRSEFVDAVKDVHRTLAANHENCVQQLINLDRQTEPFSNEVDPIDLILNQRSRFFKPTPQHVTDARIESLLALAPEAAFTAEQVRDRTWYVETPDDNDDDFWGDFPIDRTPANAPGAQSSDVPNRPEQMVNAETMNIRVRRASTHDTSLHDGIGLDDLFEMGDLTAPLNGTVPVNGTVHRNVPCLRDLCLMLLRKASTTKRNSRIKTGGEVRVAGTPTPEVRVAGTPTPEVRVAGTPTPEVRVVGTPTPEVRVVGTPTPEVRVAGTPTPEVRVAGTPTPEVRVAGTPTPEVRVVGTPTPEVRVAGTPTPEVRVAGTPTPTPTPEVRVVGTPTPEVRVAGTPTPTPTPEVRVVGTPTPEVRVAGTPTPEVRVAGTPTPEVRVAGTPTPEVRVAGTRECFDEALESERLIRAVVDGATSLELFAAETADLSNKKYELFNKMWQIGIFKVDRRRDTRSTADASCSVSLNPT